MKFPFAEIHSLEDAQRNFEAIESQHIYTGDGAPGFTPTDGNAYYFRFDTPGTAMQRIYVFDGSTWTGIV